MLRMWVLTVLGVALVVGVVTALAVAAVRGLGVRIDAQRPRVGVAVLLLGGGWLSAGSPSPPKHSTETHRTSLFSGQALIGPVTAETSVTGLLMLLVAKAPATQSVPGAGSAAA